MTLTVPSWVTGTFGAEVIGVADATTLQAGVEAILAEVDSQMSTYRDDSLIERFNRAPAQQDAALPLGDAADDHFRILVMDGAAGVADMARQGVAGRNLEGDGCAAVAAEVHRVEGSRSGKASIARRGSRAR